MRVSMIIIITSSFLPYIITRQSHFPLSNCRIIWPIWSKIRRRHFVRKYSGKNQKIKRIQKITGIVDNIKDYFKKIKQQVWLQI